MQLSQLEIEQLATESSQPTESTTQTWETRQTQETRETQETTAAPRLRQSQDGTIQALDKSYSIQMKQKLGCFGRRLDRIGSSRSLGCNGECPLPALLRGRCGGCTCTSLPRL